MEIINFPKNEWEDIQKRLEENKPVYTVRVSEEYGKYQEGDLLETEWGTKVKVISVKKIDGGIEELEKEYRYFKQLSSEIIQELSPFEKMEIIRLEKF